MLQSPSGYDVILQPILMPFSVAPPYRRLAGHVHGLLCLVSVALRPSMVTLASRPLADAGRQFSFPLASP